MQPNQPYNGDQNTPQQPYQQGQYPPQQPFPPYQQGQYPPPPYQQGQYPPPPYQQGQYPPPLYQQVTPPPKPPVKPIWKRLPWWVWAIVGVVVIAGIVGGTKSNTTVTATTSTPVPVAAVATSTVLNTTIAATTTPPATSPVAATTLAVVNTTTAPSVTSVPTIAPTVAPTVPPPTPTLKPIAVFGQGIGTSLNSSGEPQSPTSRYQENADAYFFLNYQDATPNETIGIFITKLDGKTQIFNSQKAFGQPVGFVTFLVSVLTPGAYQAHFEARGQRIGSLFNFEVLPKPTPVPPTATPLPPVAKLSPLNSRGIGLSRDEWEAINGQPTLKYHPTKDQGAYKGNYFLVGYNNDKIWTLSLQFEDSPMTINDAKALALSYMPSDTKYIKSYVESISGDKTYLYQSRSIISRFPSPDFPWTIANTQGQILLSFVLDYNNPNKVLDIDIVLASEEDLDG